MRYKRQGDQLVAIPEMQEPNIPKVYGQYDTEMMVEYQQHIASLPGPYNISSELSEIVKDGGEIDDSEFEVKHTIGVDTGTHIFEGKAIAFPVKKADVWEEMIEKYKEDTGRSVFATNAFTNWLKQHYTLTKKQTT